MAKSKIKGKKRTKKGGGNLWLKRILIVLGIFMLFQILFLVGIVMYGIFFHKPSNQTQEEISSPEEFFQEYAPLAKKIGKKYNLMPSMILAQAAHESRFGESELSQEYHNFFGIKGTVETGALLPTVEVNQNEAATVDQYFRKYKNPKESFEDYGKLISGAKRYEEVVAAETPEEYAYALQKAGYATDPQYGDKLLSLFTIYDLGQYDVREER